MRSDFAFVCLVDCLTLALFVKALHSSILVARIVLLGDTKMHWLCESRNLILMDVLTVSYLRFVVKLVRGDFLSFFLRVDCLFVVAYLALESAMHNLPPLLAFVGDVL